MDKPSGLEFLPKIDEKSDLVELIRNKKIGIKQGSFIGDCYLITSILSIIFSTFPVVNYIFPESNEYDEFSDDIRMLVFENGIRKEILFNNTYPLNENYEYIFGKPMDHSFWPICIEKGYAAYYSNKSRNIFSSKPKEFTIKSGYENIQGGQEYKVFNFLFGNIVYCII